jgi:hypothetical protein
MASAAQQKDGEAGASRRGSAARRDRAHDVTEANVTRDETPDHVW